MPSAVATRTDPAATGTLALPAAPPSTISKSEYVHPFTQMALSMLVDTNLDSAKSYSVFVDGSGGNGREDKPAWGMTVIANNVDGAFSCMGVLGDALTDEGTEVAVHYTSEQQRHLTENLWPDGHWGPMTSNIAENVGMVWAMLWAVQQSPRKPVSIHSDSLITTKCVEAQRFAKALAPAAELLRDVARVADTHLDVAFGHVAAHAGHPWNECADTVAKLASKNLITMPRPLP